MTDLITVCWSGVVVLPPAACLLPALTGWPWARQKQLAGPAAPQLEFSLAEPLGRETPEVDGAASNANRQQKPEAIRKPGGHPFRPARVNPRP